MSLRPGLADVSKGHGRPRSPRRPWWPRDQAGARHGGRRVPGDIGSRIIGQDRRRMGIISAGRTTGRQGVPQASGGQESSSGPAGARSRLGRRWLIRGWGGAPATGNQGYLLRIWSTVDRRFPIPFGGWGVPGGRTGARSPLRDTTTPTPLAEEETVPEPDPADGWPQASSLDIDRSRTIVPDSRSATSARQPARWADRTHRRCRARSDVVPMPGARVRSLPLVSSTHYRGG